MEEYKLWPAGFVEKFAIQVGEELGISLTDTLRLNTDGLTNRVHFVNCAIEDCKLIADLVVGYQLLNWLNADEKGLPGLESLRAINEILVPGGLFIAGTSSGFVGVDPNATIEGMTKREYLLDYHPFVRLVYQEIAHEVKKITGKMQFEPLSKSQFTIEQVKSRVEEAGFVNVRLGAFLITHGIEEILGDVMHLRPIHQGRLDDIPDQKLREAIMEVALARAHRESDRVKIEKGYDPRTITDKNVWDAVSFIVAEKPAA